MRIAFQGEAGANGHRAAQEVAPDLEPLPCATFDDAFAAVREGRAARAVIPVENTLHGRVTDIHHLLPQSGLVIVGEHFLPIHHQLMAVRGATLEGLEAVMSQEPALGQCRRLIRERGLRMIVGADTAGSARRVAEAGDPKVGALASALAAEIYGLDILARDVEDAPDNVTRFLVMARDPVMVAPGVAALSSFVFRVRNVPAALYKALGGFATNGVNITKLESYLAGGFVQAMFYADVEGRPSDPALALALEELRFFCTDLVLLGTYPASPWRAKNGR